VAQAAAHWPLAHLATPLLDVMTVHACPQVPQFAGSVALFVHMLFDTQEVAVVVHVPVVQDWQPPEALQPELQQCPSPEQKLVEHWPPELHATPAPFLGMQLPFMQKFPLTQSPSPVQVVRQADVEAQVRPPEHARWVPGEQRPPPSQDPAGVYWFEFAHEAVPHRAPFAGMRQAPAPLQKPSRPQGLVASLAHSLSGSAPFETGAHFPLAWPVLELAHAAHLPSHLTSQQKPSAQKPEAHSAGLATLQAVPAAFFAAQLVPAQ
jgi:hypothetical protein